MILRLLNWQGIGGLAASVALLGLLVVQRLDARHWHRSSDRFEHLYGQEQLAFARTTAAYREAADAARADDRANLARVSAEQQTINERTEDDYEKRLAAARLAADRLRRPSTGRAADPGDGGAASVPGLPAAAGGAPEAAGDDRFPESAALIATEQAIQLDELIAWVRKQAAVDPSQAPAARSVHP